MMSEVPTFFLSYAREDVEFVVELAARLRNAGANLWLDQLDILGGQRWDRAVEQALRRCDGLIAVLSPAAVASRNFLDEVGYALEEGKHIVPILYRDCRIPLRLRRLHYLDFTGDAKAGYADLARALDLEDEEVSRAEGTGSVRTTTALDEELAARRDARSARPESPKWGRLSMAARLTVEAAVIGVLSAGVEVPFTSLHLTLLGGVVILSFVRFMQHFGRPFGKRFLLAQLELMAMWSAYTIGWCIVHGWRQDFYSVSIMIWAILALTEGAAFRIAFLVQRSRGRLNS